MHMGSKENILKVTITLRKEEVILTMASTQRSFWMEFTAVNILLLVLVLVVTRLWILEG